MRDGPKTTEFYDRRPADNISTRWLLAARITVNRGNERDRVDQLWVGAIFCDIRRADDPVRSIMVVAAVNSTRISAKKRLKTTQTKGTRPLWSTKRGQVPARNNMSISNGYGRFFGNLPILWIWLIVFTILILPTDPMRGIALNYINKCILIMV